MNLTHAKNLIFGGEKMSVINIGELRKIILIIAVLLLFALVIIVPILLIKKLANKSKKPSHYPSVAPKDSPYISVEYMKSGSLLDDGKCGWLDIECETGRKETIELNFKKASPQFFIPLSIGKCQITYRSKSKAAMAAESAMSSLSQGSALSSAVYEAGVGKGQLSSVVVEVDASFVMRLGCSTDGFNGSCDIIS